MDCPDILNEIYFSVPSSTRSRDRMYTLRRIRDRFKENRVLTEPSEIEEQYKEGMKSLEVIKRQVLVSQLYKPEKLIIEKLKEEGQL